MGQYVLYTYGIPAEAADAPKCCSWLTAGPMVATRAKSLNMHVCTFAQKNGFTRASLVEVNPASEITYHNQIVGARDSCARDKGLLNGLNAPNQLKMGEGGLYSSTKACVGL